MCYAVPPGRGRELVLERSHVVVCLRGGLRGSGYGAVALHVVARAAVRLRQRVHQRLVDVLFLGGGLRRGRGTAGSTGHGGRERGVTRGLSYRCRSARPFALKTSAAGVLLGPLRILRCDKGRRLNRNFSNIFPAELLFSATLIGPLRECLLHVLVIRKERPNSCAITRVRPRVSRAPHQRTRRLSCFSINHTPRNLRCRMLACYLSKLVALGLGKPDLRSPGPRGREYG